MVVATLRDNSRRQQFGGPDSKLGCGSRDFRQEVSANHVDQFFESVMLLLGGGGSLAVLESEHVGRQFR